MSFYSGFYSDPFGPQPTMLVGETTFNGMTGSPSVPTPAGQANPMAAVSLELGIAGVVSQAAGAFFNASAARSQGKIAEVNARMARLAAYSAMDAGQKEAGRLSMKAGQIKSSQRVAMAANGIDLGSGNAAELQASTDLMKEIDMNTIKSNAVRSAWGYKTQAMNYDNQAKALKSTSPVTAAGNTLLTGATNVAANWYAMNKIGAI